MYGTKGLTKTHQAQRKVGLFIVTVPSHLMYGKMDVTRQTDRQTDRQADRQTDRQTGRQTETETETETERDRDKDKETKDSMMDKQQYE